MLAPRVLADQGRKPQEGRGRLPRRLRLSAAEAWRQPLPGDKEQLFSEAMHGLEASYGMLSVALNDAIHLRGRGSLRQARALVGFSGLLLERMRNRLVLTLDSMTTHSQHGLMLAQLTPVVLPMNPGYFRHQEGRRMAVQQGYVQLLLWDAHSRFFQKLRALRSAVLLLSRRFLEAAEEIADGSCVTPAESWQELDDLHYDLNTCLREVVVLLKTLLFVLPGVCFRALRADILSRVCREAA